MTRHYVAYTALKRDKAIVTFLTTSSPFQKIKAVFNAAVADMALANSFRLKQCFNQAAKADAPAPLKAAKGFLEALYTRSHSTLRWRAALQIVQKALSHAGWEKAHKNKSLSKYSHSFYKLIDRQIKTEEQNAAALRCHDAFEARLARFTPGLTSAKSREWVAEIVKNKDVLQAQSRKREALYSKLYDKNPLNAAPVITQDMGQRIILKLFKDMGIDETNADIYFSSHPMCFDKNGRAQILLRKDYTNFFDAVLDAVHEGGHALYRINMPDDVRLSMMGLIETNYAGVDEATAMIFDQNLALSKEFAAYLSSLIMSEGKNELSAYYTPECVFHHLNANPYSLTRTKAGPEQYALFMAQYSALEDGLFARIIKGQDLAILWDKLSNDLHGIAPNPDSTRESVFQDPHWALGELGRFAGGYLPGTLMAAQICEYMRATAPQILPAIQNGDFAPLRQWCSTHLYNQMRHDNFDDFMIQVTGKKVTPTAFFNAAKRDIAQIKSIKRPQIDGARPPKI